MAVHPTWRTLAYICALSLAYFAVARAGLALQSVNHFAGLIWPASGISIAALLLFGRNIWPGILLGAFFTNFAIGASIPVAAAIGFGNTAEAMFALHVLHLMRFDLKLSRLSDAFAFVVASIIAPVLSASIGVGALVLGGAIPLSESVTTWIPWWIGDCLGILIMAPLILVWSIPVAYSWNTRNEIERWTSIACTMILSVFTFLIFSPSAFQPFLYLLFVPLAWTALRSGLRSTTLSVFFLAAIAETGALLDKGIFKNFSTDAALLWTQLFLGTAAGGFLILAAIARERKADQTAMIENMAKLEAALKRISGEDKAKSEFIAILAHELRNPLAPVLSTLEFMQLETVGANEEVLRSISSITHHVKSMSRLLDDLLDISRINNRKYRLERSVIPLSRVVAHAVEVSSLAIGSRNQLVNVTMPKEEVYIDADHVRLEQVITNVLNNAAKFTAEGGKISLTVTEDVSTITISVRDNGIGIDKETLPYIFEPFRRATDHPRATPGLGLGLSLTKRLVELHGGSVAMYSPGKNLGSEFVITLPRTTLTPAPVQPQPQPVVSIEKHRVLVVDDNKPAAQGLAKLLQHFGYETALAYDGNEALAAISDFHPTVAVLDIGLPGMSGYEVAQKALLLDGAPALVAVTGYGQSADKLRAKDSGFAYHLTKPIGIRDLTSVLDKIKR